MSQVAKSALALECAFFAMLLVLMKVRSFRLLNWQSFDFAYSDPHHSRSSRSGLSGLGTSHQRFAELSISDSPHLGESDLERQVRAFVEHYNHVRYHESIDNLTPADVYFCRAEAILAERNRIKRNTIANRRLQHQLQAA